MPEIQNLMANSPGVLKKGIETENLSKGHKRPIFGTSYLGETTSKLQNERF